nr:transmembrane protein 209 isoform X2 [Ipomoea batatas]
MLDLNQARTPYSGWFLPPKERFPEKYVAVVSGVPSVLHPGACVLAVGKQSPPVFALFWDKKPQFSLQARKNSSLGLGIASLLQDKGRDHHHPLALAPSSFIICTQQLIWTSKQVLGESVASNPYIVLLENDQLFPKSQLPYSESESKFKYDLGLAVAVRRLRGNEKGLSDLSLHILLDLLSFIPRSSEAA